MPCMHRNKLRFVATMIMMMVVVIVAVVADSGRMAACVWNCSGWQRLHQSCISVETYPQ